MIAQRDAEYSLHEVTHRQFLPFVVRLLSEGPLPPGSRELPVREPAAMTREAVEAVREIVPRAVWRRICRKSGWRRIPVLVEGEKTADLRLWQHPDLDGFRMEFSEAAVDFLMVIFNATRKQVEESREAGPEWIASLRAGKNGDLLLQHFVYRRLRASRIPISQSLAELFRANPLNIIVDLPWFQFSEPNLQDFFARMLEPDLEPLLPWLCLEWPGCWAARESHRWRSGAEGFRRSNIAEGAVFGGWLHAVEGAGRLDLAAPLLKYLGRLFELPSAPAALHEKFEELTMTFRMEDRRRLAENWLLALQVAFRLRDLQRQARSVHPIEREPVEKIFLDQYARQSFDNAAAHAEQLVATILPAVG